MALMITGLGIDPGAYDTRPAARRAEPVARHTEPGAPRRLGAIDEDNLFGGGLVASNPAGRTRRAKVLFALFVGALTLEFTAVVLALLIPIFLPSDMPDQGDRRVVFFDPPPPPPPPLPKGSPLKQQQAEPETPKPVTDVAKPKPEFTAPIETPQPQQTAQLQPEAGIRPEDQFGSLTGSDFGDPLGMEEGVEGGVVGGVPGGVLGGVLGGTGTGPVMDYDAAPRPIKITRPQYPQEAFVKKVEGTVVVEILIDSQGRVVRARVIQSVPLLDAAALQTVYQWIFQPAVKHGRPVPTIAHAPVAFRIY
jgi:protein TonB